ncbi:hypothetical protein QOT17_022119 [Balamuthia mandrillaris]
MKTRHWHRHRLFGGLLLLLLLSLSARPSESVAPAVVSIRVENAFPPGSGEVIITFEVDSADPNAATVDSFKIVNIDNIVGDSELTEWDPSGGGSCTANTLAANDLIAATNGKACFVAGSSPPEHVSSFAYVAVDADDGNDESNAAATVTIVTYNQQDCTDIPDLGSTPSFFAPPTPAVTISLDVLRIHFQIDAAYIRNQSSYLIDFWDFDVTPGTGDHANGVNRTCSNHDAASLSPYEFTEGWLTSPQADFDGDVHASIPDALDNPDYVPYYTTNTVWSVAALSCSQVRFTASIPVSALVRNTQPTDCFYARDSDPAASSTTGLAYAASLYINVVRPRDMEDVDAGYFKTTFIYPFQFSIAETVTDLEATSEEWDFVVNILDFDVVHSGGSEGLTITLRTVIEDPEGIANSANILQSGFSAASYPLKSQRDAAGKQPVLTRVADNGNCAGSLNPCVISWTAVFSELTEVQAGSISNFNLQYTGEFEFQWSTEVGGDILRANFYVDVSAEDPGTDIGEIPVPSAVEFFETQAAMQLVVSQPNGISPSVFSSGEDIWVRHSFLVDDADAKAFEFTLKQAFVCYSMVAGVVPTIAGGNTGCSVDIEGVIEEGRGSRIVLFDEVTLPAGIADVTPANPGEIAKVWDWRQVDFDAGGWESERTVHNGFGIRAQPLVVEDRQQDWYFHIVSGVSQAPLDKRRGEKEEARREEVVHTFVPVKRKRKRKRKQQTEGSTGELGRQLQSVTILPERPESEGGGSGAGRTTGVFELGYL